MKSVHSVNVSRSGCRGGGGVAVAAEADAAVEAAAEAVGVPNFDPRPLLAGCSIERLFLAPRGRLRRTSKTPQGLVVNQQVNHLVTLSNLLSQTYLTSQTN